MPVDAVLLAGGRGSRLGGADKPGLEVGGRTLLDRALEAAAGCRRIVVVGPQRPVAPRQGGSPAVLWTRESPPFSGPAAALSAGLKSLASNGTPPDSVLVLATDLPYVSATHIAALVDHLGHAAVDAVFARDGEDNVQFLFGLWRWSALARWHDDDLAGRSIRSLVPRTFDTLDTGGTDDVDTVADLRRIRAEQGDRPTTLTVAHAREALRENLEALPSATAPIADALGGTLAEDLVASEPCPRFDTSAMDGYAVSGPGPWHLEPDVVLAGGSAGPAALGPGRAVRIATGAVVPAGADRVVRDEFAESSPTGELTRRSDTPVREDIRRSGEDWSAGAVLAPAGCAITPALVSVAITAGVSTVAVRGPVTASIVVTGTEVHTGPDAPGPGHIRDSIGPVLPIFLQHSGFHVLSTEHAADTEFGLDAIFRSATPRSEPDRSPDVVVVVGATGAGAADTLRDALARVQARIVVPSVACRPGGGAVVAVLPSGRIVLGLPGNPFAAVAAAMLLGPALAAGLCRRPPTIPLTGHVHGLRPGRPDVARLVPVRYQGNDDWRAENDFRTAHLGGLVDNDGIAVVAEGDVTDRVEILPIPSG